MTNETAVRRVLLGLYTYLEFALSGVLFLIPMGLATLRHRNDPGQRIRGRWMRRFGSFTSALTPLWRFRFEGTPPADISEKPYVVVTNHESVADPFLLCSVPWDQRFIAKDELFHLPLIGWLMKLGGDIPLKRGDRQSVEAMLAECRRTLDAGVPVLLFPEGTRTKDGNLLPFKDGAFQIAIDAQVPVLPLAIEGSRACLPKHSKFLGDADAVVKALEPIPTTGMTRADVPRLREQVRERIALGVSELRARRGLAPVHATPAPTAGEPSEAQAT